MEQEKPMISVIVPVYNVEAWIGRCLDSILAQTYETIEVILINDASSDESGRICDHYAARDGRITVLHFSENRGPSAARNEGIRKARGAFASFIDSDDYVEPCLLEKLYDNLLENGADVSACGADGIKLKGGPPGTFSRSEAVCCLAHGVPFNHVPWGKLYTMELVKKHPFDERYFYSEDLLFLYEILKSSNRVSYLPDRLYHYVNREGSQVHSGVSVRKLTALKVHDHVCDHAGERFPEAALYFRRLSLDVDSRWAMLTVESDAEKRQIFSLLKRLQSHIRRHYDRKALQLLPERKSRVAVRTLHASVPLFWGMASLYKYVKRWLRK